MSITTLRGALSQFLVVLAGVSFSAVLSTVVAAESQLVLPPLPSKDQSTESPSTHCRYSGSFEQQRTLPDINSKIVSSGKFLFSCKRGLVWEVLEPVTDTSVYTYLDRHFRIRKNGRVRELIGFAERRTAKLLLDFLGGDHEALARDFNVNEPDADGIVVIVPRKKRTRKYLTQIRMVRSNTSVQVQIETSTSGNVTLDLTNVIAQNSSDNANCEAFSSRPRMVCKVFVKPSDFIGPDFNQSR